MQKTSPLVTSWALGLILLNLFISRILLAHFFSPDLEVALIIECPYLLWWKTAVKCFSIEIQPVQQETPYVGVQIWFCSSALT